MDFLRECVSKLRVLENIVMVEKSIGGYSSAIEVNEDGNYLVINQSNNNVERLSFETLETLLAHFTKIRKISMFEISNNVETIVYEDIKVFRF
jgi:hypothetical protein